MRKIFVSLDSITGIIVNSHIMEKTKPSSEGFLRLLGSCYRDQRPLGVAPALPLCSFGAANVQLYLIMFQIFLKIFL